MKRDVSSETETAIRLVASLLAYLRETYSRPGAEAVVSEVARMLTAVQLRSAQRNSGTFDDFRRELLGDRAS